MIASELLVLQNVLRSCRPEQLESLEQFISPTQWKAGQNVNFSIDLQILCVTL